jgi:pimeloyl-ACP methyl ester carboxylesterase
VSPEAHGQAPIRAVPGGPALPGRPRYLRVGAIKISYVDIGDGPVILLLHGLGHSTHGWRKVMVPLAAAGYRVMAVDLPGFGYSDKPGNYTLDMYVDFVAGWLDQHCIERAAVVGNSMGGAITAAVAAMRPDRVAAAVLVDPGGFGKEVTWLLRLAGLRFLRFLPRRRISRRQVRHGLRLIVANPQAIEDADVDRIVELADLPGAREAFLEIAHDAIGFRGVRPGQQLGELTRRITAPTLVIWGDRDRVIPPAHAQLANQAIPHAQVAIIEGTGHVPQLEAPERFTELVLRFLAQAWPPEPDEG